MLLPLWTWQKAEQSSKFIVLAHRRAEVRKQQMNWIPKVDKLTQEEMGHKIWQIMGRKESLNKLVRIKEKKF